MIIYFPNSPGVPVTVDRGGTDPVTGEEYGEQIVVQSWEVDDGPDDEGNPRSHIERRVFLGPA